MPPMGRVTLAALLDEQRQLQAQIDDLEADPRRTLAAGEALLGFAAREAEAFWHLEALLDPAARVELATEHQQFAEDLELLDWLLETASESPDVTVLNASLRRRMRQHIERDGRFLARAVDLAART
jgi:hypothetical protein